MEGVSERILQLCVRGMEAEGRGDSSHARELFTSAWNEAQSPTERCVAAHYVARHQPTSALTLEWNQRALDFARQVTDGSANGFLPSLLLNVAHSTELIGDREGAHRGYKDAAAAAVALADDGYGRFLRRGIESGLKRTSDPDAPATPRGSAASSPFRRSGGARP